MRRKNLDDEFIKKIKEILDRYENNVTHIIDNDYTSFTSDYIMLTLDLDQIIISFAVYTPPDVSSLIVQELIEKINIKLTIGQVHIKTIEGEIIFGSDAEKYYFTNIKRTLERKIEKKLIRAQNEMNFLIHSEAYEC